MLALGTQGWLGLALMAVGLVALIYALVNIFNGRERSEYHKDT